MDQEPIVQELPVSSPTSSPKKGWKIFSWLVLILVLALAAGGIYWTYYRQNKNQNKTTQPAVADTGGGSSQTDTAQTTTAKVELIKDDGYTWTTPKKIDDIGLCKKENTFGDSADDADVYYQVGETGGGEMMIVGQCVSLGPLSSSFLVKKDKDGRFSLFTAYSSDGYNDFIDFSKSVTPVETKIPSLSVPDFLKLTEETLVRQNTTFSGGMFLDLENTKLTKLTDTPYGPLYIYSRPVYQDDQNTKEYEGLAIQSLILKRNDGRTDYFQPQATFLRDDHTVNATWNVSAINAKATFTTEEKGCGAGTASLVVTGKALLAQQKTIGKTADGQSLTYVDDSSSALVQALYNKYYLVGREGSTGQQPIDITSYTKAYPYFIWLDGFGRAEVFQNNQDYGMLAECGKPVIYLYPERPMTVSVQVGAELTKSEPAYQNGWTVQARPSGQLSLNGQTYPYLFWEGHGQGLYPDVQQTGVVVKQADLIPTIKSQMTTLGLTAKEQSDFLDFWASRLPTTPYTRLTWLGTADMNRIAPLTITPAPRTLIRVFLDFAGLEKPVDLKPQNLRTIPRQGFTVVEWGGLLR